TSEATHYSLQKSYSFAIALCLGKTAETIWNSRISNLLCCLLLAACSCLHSIVFLAGFGGMSTQVTPAKRPHDQTLTELSGRTKLQKSSVSDNVSPAGPSSIRVIRVLFSASKIGGIIGKGGSTISQIRQETGAKVRVEESIPGCDERVIIITGTGKDNESVSEQVKTESKETESHENGEKPEEHGEADEKQAVPDDNSQSDNEKDSSSVQKALLVVFGKMVDILSDKNEGDEESINSITFVVRLLVFSGQVGCLLGKAGSVIKQMSSESGAHIRVLPKDKLPSCASSSDELVQISGKRDAVRKALLCVSQQLLEKPLHNQDSFSAHIGGPPSHSFGPPSRRDRFPPPNRPFHGQGPPFSAGFHDVEPGMPGGPVNFPPEILTFRILCSEEKVGGVIGKGGSVVKALQNETGCEIKIQDGENDSEDRIIIISGPAVNGELEVVQEALLQITSRLKSHFFGDVFPPFGHHSDPAFLDQGPPGPFPSYMGRREFSPSRTFPDRGPPFNKFEGPGGPPFHPHADHVPFGHDFPRSRIPPHMSERAGPIEGPGPMGFPDYPGPPHRRFGGFPGGNQPAVITNTAVEVVVPRFVVPAIYGEDGGCLRQIREISEANVTIMDPKPGAEETLIKISGTPEQTNAAQSLIQAFQFAHQDTERIEMQEYLFSFSFLFSLFMEGVPMYSGFKDGSLKATLLDANLQIVSQEIVNFDSGLPHYNTKDGVYRDPLVNGRIVSPTIMWVEALDLILEKLKRSGLDFGKIAAISGSGQQHGSVYWKTGSRRVLSSLDPKQKLVDQLREAFSVNESPVWMDSSTVEQCKEIEQAVGGALELSRVSGSRAYERYTGPQIRKIFETRPEAYLDTERISLVSSFMASLLIGSYACIDHTDGAGMNLMDIKERAWSERLLEVTAPGLEERLGKLAPAYSVAGLIAPYFVDRYLFDKNCLIIQWSGDNPNSLAGLTLNSPGDLAISLGTSDTLFGIAAEHKPCLEGHVFPNPVDPKGYMVMLCYKNGSLTREEIRNRCADKSWDTFNALLQQTQPLNGGKIGFYYKDHEIMPPLPVGIHRYILENFNGDTLDGVKEREVRALIEGQFLSMRAHAERFGMPSPKRIIATGGASSNNSILGSVASIFGSNVYKVQSAGNVLSCTLSTRLLEYSDSASMGAALRAAHGWLCNKKGIFVPISNMYMDKLENTSLDCKLAVTGDQHLLSKYTLLMKKRLEIENRLVEKLGRL
ncbi:xylulose kinase, partial [Striga asiatica]